MKNTIYLLVFLFVSLNMSAQITIVKADMPSPDDTFRISTAATSSYDFTLTGANYNWDFSQLQPSSQKMESYVAISATPAIYNVVFMYPFVATIARERPDAQLATISITDGYDFFKATNSEFKQVGFGAEINGAPIPVQFQSADVIYPLPLTYGKQDSSDAFWQLSIPSLGYISQKIHRVNTVDGWGQVTTPYGTFNCLRIKSVVNQTDSFHYDSIPFPFPAIPSQYTEYLWMTNGKGFPLVKATDRNGIFRVEYIDSIQSFAGISKTAKNDEVRIFPNPASRLVYIQTAVPLKNIRIFDLQGKIIYQSETNHKIDVGNQPKGVYFVRLETADRIIYKRLIIN